MPETIRFLADVHVPSAIIRALRQHGIDVQTAQEAGKRTIEDDELLMFALSERRVILTQDDNFLRLHATGLHHGGIAYGHQRLPYKRIVSHLVLMTEVLEPDDMIDHLEYL